MKCLLKYQWVKLPREIKINCKGIMGSWMKLASRAAFRKGKAAYCGYRNEVAAGSWSGGIVGVKSILGVKSRQKAFDILDRIQGLGLLKYTLDDKTKKLTYTITDWVINCSGADCSDSQNVYATDGYGFICIPRNVTDHLTENNYVFDEADAWLDLWCHTVWRDERNIFSYEMPVIQYGKYGIALTLETLGKRWKWEKTKVWRFLKKTDAFALHKLPSSYGCLIFNTMYPIEALHETPSCEKVLRILSEIRKTSQNTFFEGTENEKINKLLAWHSKRICSETMEKTCPSSNKNRVADSAPIIRAYFSPCKNCMNCIYDCTRIYKKNPFISLYSLNPSDYVLVKPEGG